MEQQDIRILLQKYVAGQCTTEEQLLVETWYRQYAENSRADMEKLDIPAAQAAIWQQLQQQTQPKVRRLHTAWKVAAGLLLLISAGLLLRRPQTKWKEVYADAMQQLSLPDGSKVWLNAGSRLRYPAHFSGTAREVELVSGEACLTIANDPEHPFMIRSGDVKTKVLGTIFNVRSYQQLHFMQVTVQQGKVAVIHGNNTMFLLPDERATLYAGNENFVKDTVDAVGINAWTSNQLLFNNERLDVIAAILENKYHVRIELANTELAADKITAGFAASDSLPEVLEELSLANQLQYKKVGNKFVVNIKNR